MLRQLLAASIVLGAPLRGHATEARQAPVAPLASPSDAGAGVKGGAQSSSPLTIDLKDQNSHFNSHGGTVCMIISGFTLVQQKSTIAVSILDGKTRLWETWVPFDDKPLVTTDTAGTHICLSFTAPHETPLKDGQQIQVEAMAGTATLATSTAVDIPGLTTDLSRSTPNLWVPSARAVLGYERGESGSLAAANNYVVDLALQVPFGKYQAARVDAGPVQGTIDCVVVAANGTLELVPAPYPKCAEPKDPNEAKPLVVQDGRRLTVEPGNGHLPWGSGWLRLRLTGKPTTAVPNVAKVLTGVSPINSVEQVGQGLSLSGGLEFKTFFRPYEWPGGTAKEAFWIEPVILVEGGVTTTLDASAVAAAPPAAGNFYAVEDPTRMYDAMTNPNVPHLTDLYPNVSGKTYLTLIPTTPARFYRQVAVGLRIKTHHLDYGEETGFPGIIDVTVGGDESVTPTKLRCCNVFHVGAFYALPQDLFGSSVFVFGSVTALLHGAHAIPTLMLTPVPSGSTGPSVFPPSQTAVNLLLPQGLDTWRIGVGVDLLALVKKINGKSSSTSGAAKQPASGQ
jgi:hypothetical protein